MDELCKDKPWMEPLVVAGLNIENTNTSEDEKKNKKEKTSKKALFSNIFKIYVI